MPNGPRVRKESPSPRKKKGSRTVAEGSESKPSHKELSSVEDGRSGDSERSDADDLNLHGAVDEQASASYRDSAD